MDNIIPEYLDYVNNKVAEEKTQRTTIEEKNSNPKDYNKNASERIFFEKGVQTVEKYGDIYTNNDNNIKSSKIIYNNENLMNYDNYNKNIKTSEIGFQTNNNYNDIGDIINEKNEKEIKDYTLNNKDENKNISHQSKYVDVVNNKKEIIFKIFKERKKKFGRKKKKSGLFGKHNKYCIDNIIRKVKAKLIDSSFNYINKKFKNKKLCLLKIIGAQSKEINRNKNLLWLNKTLKDIFYEDISKKSNNPNKNYNRQLIDKIYKENNEKEVIELLNITILEYLKFYTSINNITDMKQLNDDINELKSIGESEHYTNEYKRVSENFYTIIKNFKSRERKKK